MRRFCTRLSQFEKCNPSENIACGFPPLPDTWKLIPRSHSIGVRERGRAHSSQLVSIRMNVACRGLLCTQFHARAQAPRTHTHAALPLMYTFRVISTTLRLSRRKCIYYLFVSPCDSCHVRGYYSHVHAFRAGSCNASRSLSIKSVKILIIFIVRGIIEYHHQSPINWNVFSSSSLLLSIDRPLSTSSMSRSLVISDVETRAPQSVLNSIGLNEGWARHKCRESVAHSFEREENEMKRICTQFTSKQGRNFFFFFSDRLHHLLKNFLIWCRLRPNRTFSR